MCGRYAFFQRPSAIRQQLDELNMPSQSAPDDEETRLSYNFCPGYYGLVYRAQTSDAGAGAKHDADQPSETAEPGDEAETNVEAEHSKKSSNQAEVEYKLQAMKWGLIPFWTKRNPDYGSMMKTINCRDDSLIEDRGMWTTMKKKKRCIVLCQGFYEWLKKNNGKDRIPHYIKRKDGQLFCFAGLWDCVKYDDSEDKHYTYTIITTDSNKQLKFLHDRMPVVLEAGSDALRLWLDPNRTEWGKDLQSLLKPYEGELEIYPVNKDVGKVGNNSPTFIIPIDSADNKSNIANFFNNQKKAAKGTEVKKEVVKTEDDVEKQGITVKQDPSETRGTKNEDTNTESHAPVPTPPRGIKREHDEANDHDLKTSTSPRKEQKLSSPTKTIRNTGRQTRSATSNGTVAPKSASNTVGSQKITKFFGK